MRRLLEYVEDLLANIVAVERFTVDGRDAFLNDVKTQYAVIRAYEIIGEIVKRLPADLLENYPNVEWKQIAGFRDFLIHRYSAVDPEIVWGAVEKLPALRAAVEAIQKQLPED